MSAKFNYTISTETLNGILNFEKLNRDFYKLELNEELITITVESNNLCFEFVSPMNDQSTANDLLDTLVNTHDGIAIAKPRICALLGENHIHDNYVNVNYKIEPKPNLFPKRYFTQGELRTVEWYSEKEFTNLILKAEMVYDRDPFGFASKRTTTRTWYDTDGLTLENIKVTEKVYSSLEQIKEGKRRRANIVDGIQLPTMSFMVETMTVAPWNLDQMTILLMGRDFMDRKADEFSNFIDNSSTVTSGEHAGKKSVVVAFINAATTTDTWLKNTPSALGGATIEQYLIGEFSI